MIPAADIENARATAWLEAANNAVKTADHDLLRAVLHASGDNVLRRRPDVSGRLLRHAATLLLTHSVHQAGNAYVLPPHDQRLATLCLLLDHGLQWQEVERPSLKSVAHSWATRYRKSDTEIIKLQGEGLRRLKIAGLNTQRTWNDLPFIHHALLEGDPELALLWHQVGGSVLDKNGNTACHALLSERNANLLSAKSGMSFTEILALWRDRAPIAWWTQPNRRGRTALDAFRERVQQAANATVAGNWSRWLGETEAVVLRGSLQELVPQAPPVPSKPRL